MGIAAGGAGVGRLADGRTVFVQRTAPGDLAKVAVTELRPRWARAQLLRVLEPAEGRRQAPCVHYACNGGCTLEHLEYGAQRAAKSKIVHEALRRIGHIELPAPEVIASPRELQYRNRVSWTLLRLDRGRVVAGFHELDRPGRIADIDHRCMLPEPAIARAWRALRANWGENANRLPAGQQLRLTLRAVRTGAVSLLVEGGYGDGRPADLLQRVPEISAIWRRDADAAPVLLAGEEFLEERWGEETIRLSGAVFLQVNREAAMLLENHVLELAGDVAGRKIVDAYAGIGLHALRLSRRGARVTCIEADGMAVAEGRRLAGGSVQFLEGRVEDLIDSALPADLVIVNPPRAGVDARVAERLVERPPERIIYVSCDPATLARDVDRLRARFTPASIRCFDLFPQTAHVETVMELRCVTP